MSVKTSVSVIKDDYFIGVVILTAVLLSQCSGNLQDPLPENIQNLENLIVYSRDVQAPYNIQFECETSYGNAEDVQIGTLGGFSADEHGRIFIADMQQRSIYVLKEDGLLADRIGRQGNGPGEFQNGPFPYIIADRLYAVDMMLLRLSMFNAKSFELIQTLNLIPKNQSRHALENSQIQQVFPIDSNRFLLSFVPFHSEIPSSTGQRLERGYVDYYIIDSDRDVISERVFSHKHTPFLTGIVDGQLQIASQFQLFSESLVGVSENGSVFTAQSGDFLIKKYTAEGEYAQAFYYPFDHVNMQREDALKIQTTDFLREIVRQNELPETWPAIEEMLIDDENRLWISTIVEDFDIYEWWILEENGELITRFEWPRDEPIEMVKNGYMYTRETDEETGLQHIVRYQIDMEESV